MVHHRYLLSLVATLGLTSAAYAQPIGKLPAASTAVGTQLPCATIGLSNATLGCTPSQIVAAGGGSATVDASLLTSGTLSAARLPAFTGDATSPPGSSALTLNSINGNAGTFGSSTFTPVITVNAKGLITAVTTAAATGGGGGGTGLLASNNLSDVASFTTARANLNAASRTLGDVVGIQNTVSLSGLAAGAQNFGNAFHTFLMNDTLTMPPGSETNFYQGIFAQQTVGAGHTGERNGLWYRLLVHGSNAVAAGLPHNYSAITGEARLQLPLVPGVTNSGGQIFGGNFVGTLEPGASPAGEVATNLAAAEFDSIATAPVQARAIIQLDGGGSTYQGSTTDAAVIIGQGSFRAGIRFNCVDLITAAPLSGGCTMSSDGSAITFAGAQSFANFVNGNNATLTGNIFSFEGAAAQLGKNGGSYQLSLRNTGSAVNLGSTTATGSPSINLFSSGSSTPDVQILSVGGTAGTANLGALSFQAAAVVTGTAVVRPATANTGTIGAAGFPYQTAYFQTAPTITSDQRLKTEALVPLEKLAAAFACAPMHSYALRGDSRLRFGVFAQELAGCMAEQGLSWKAYAFVEHDEASDRWSANYTEIENARAMLREQGLLQ